MILTVDKIITEFDLIIGNMVPDVYTSIAMIITPCLLIALTLAIGIYGLKVMMGQVKNPAEIFPMLGKIGVLPVSMFS